MRKFFLLSLWQAFTFVARDKQPLSKWKTVVQLTNTTAIITRSIWIFHGRRTLFNPCQKFNKGVCPLFLRVFSTLVFFVHLLMCSLYCTSDLLFIKWAAKIITYRFTLLLYTWIKILRYVRKFSSEANLTILAIILPGLEFSAIEILFCLVETHPKQRTTILKSSTTQEASNSFCFEGATKYRKARWNIPPLGALNI